MLRLRIPPSLRHPRFRALWIGLLISVAGSQMQLAALHWHIRELTGEPQPLALGGIGLGTILAVLLTMRKWPALRRYNGDEPIKEGII